MKVGGVYRESVHCVGGGVYRESVHCIGGWSL